MRFKFFFTSSNIINLELNFTHVIKLVFEKETKQFPMKC